MNFKVMKQEMVSTRHGNVYTVPVSRTMLAMRIKRVRNILISAVSELDRHHKPTYEKLLSCYTNLIYELNSYTNVIQYTCNSFQLRKSICVKLR